jgi:hypothetical protein
MKTIVCLLAAQVRQIFEDSMIAELWVLGEGGEPGVNDDQVWAEDLT